MAAGAAASPLSRLLARCEPHVCSAGDPDEVRSRKAQFTLVNLLVVVAGIIWAAIPAAFGEWLAAAIPLAYSGLTLTNLAVLARRRDYPTFRSLQLTLILLLPVAMQVALGGFVSSGAVILWALMAPLLALLFTGRGEAWGWFAAFVALVIGAGVAQPAVSVTNALPDGVVQLLFVMNVVAISAVVVVMLASFMHERGRLRELEVAYLEQEVMLRQSEKLATLGTLAAGVAHELNNPAAAVGRGAGQLGPAYARLARACLELAPLGLPAEAVADLVTLAARAGPQEGSVPLDPLARSDAEQAMEEWLEERDVPEPWDLAPAIVAGGVARHELSDLAQRLPPAAVPVALTWLGLSLSVSDLIGQIGEGAGRISGMVGALRSYSYVDRGERQMVDLTEGLESTLTLLQNRLKAGVRVERDYARGLPRVQGAGGELNQVWTNLIANAIDAMEGQGTLTLRTRGDGGRVVVEVQDDGPGMPPEVADRVFDPFFTTKPPGSGTGLGLNISHRIVVQGHAGTIGVSSAPGRTCFRVTLPVAPAYAAPDGLAPSPPPEEGARPEAVQH